ncbi:17-beta-hydroxysteroid dehydrogenase type 6-like [Pyxicephalus adspersus]|uniref:17-beta-hydroxysteroid dehydrogenase type 6-like n=1 Tax=Pyxicephalus adspersus TaxID=30357 RepID=UPI003B5C987F
MWLLLLAVLGLILLYRWYRQSQILENITDKYVFITGCDSGFGNLLAKQLDKCGMNVLAACLTGTGAENLKKETSGRLQARILDVTDSESVSSAADWVSTIVGNKGNILLCTNDHETRVLNVNLLGTVDVTLQLLPLVRKARGRIVVVSSGAGRLAVIGGGYSPSKFALEAFSDSLRREMRSFGVKVSIIEPGGFNTPFNHQATHLNTINRMWEKLPVHVKESYGEDFYKKTIRVFEGASTSTMLASSKLSRVTDCMKHALTAVYPWTRYSAGWDCKLLALPISYLPTAIPDYLFSLVFPKPAHRT